MLCSVIVVFPGHLLYFSFICGMCTVCHNLFALPFGGIGRVSYVIVALPGTVSILVLLRIICFFFGYMYAVYHSLFVLHLNVISRLCYVFVSLPEHYLYSRHCYVI